MEFKETIYNRAKYGHANETNDCVVTAFATFSGVSYTDSHAVFKALGRKDTQPATGSMIRKIINRDPELMTKKMTLSHLVALYQYDTLLVAKHNHLFVIKNGVVLNDEHLRGNTLIEYFWIKHDNEKFDQIYDIIKNPPPIEQEEQPTNTNDPVSVIKQLYETHHGTMSDYAIAKLAAEKCNITPQSANYHIRKIARSTHV